VLFVDYMAEHLTPNGRAGIIVPEGIIFQSQTAYKKLRKMLVEEYLVAVEEFHDGEDEVLGFVERVENFVAGYRNRRRAGYTPLHLDEAQFAGARHTALDVVAEFLKFAIGGFEAKTALDLHDDGASPRCAGLSIGRGSRNPPLPAPSWP
jgi:hypothetical protein